MKNEQIKPPEAAVKLLKFFCRNDDFLSISGDFAEEFFDVAATRGKKHARFWYWRHLLRSLPGIFIDYYKWSSGMIKNYLKIAFRNISRNRILSFINISGFAVAIACCILIYMFIKDEISFNKFHNKSDSIYSVIYTDKYYNSSRRQIPIPMGPALKEAFPEVDRTVRISRNSNTWAVVSYKNKMFKEEYTLTDPDFFKVFSFKLIYGSEDLALSTSNSIVLKKSAAEKYFGEKNPMGKTLLLTFGNKSKEFTVTGITEDIPSNSTIQFDFLINMENIGFIISPEALNRWNWIAVHTYLLLKDGADYRNTERQFPSFVKEHFAQEEERRKERSSWNKEGDTITFWLQNLKDIYFHSRLIDKNEFSNIKKSYILAGIGILILVIAVINFTNLSIGRASARVVEIGVRKTMGAGKRDLIRQYWSESVVIVAIASVTGIMLAVMLTPLFNSLSGKSLRIIDLFSPAGIAVFVFMIIITGIIAGSYPGIVFSRQQPVSVLQGKLIMGGKNILTRVLVIFQFSVSVFLLVSTLVLGKQINFINERDYGFERERIITIDTQDSDKQSAEKLIDFFQARSALYDEIRNVSATVYALGKAEGGGTLEINGIRNFINFSNVYYNYLNTMGMELTDGRDFSRQVPADSNAVIVNRRFVDVFNIISPLGKTVDLGRSKPKIIGIVEDFHYRSLKHKIEPVIHMFGSRRGMNHMLVNVSSGEMDRSISILKDIWKEIQPGKPLIYSFMDLDLKKKYQEEKRWSSIVLYSSILSIFVTCLGLVGITSITISKRIKEIGIRKVMGASVSRIGRLLTFDFLILILTGNLIACPMAYYFMNKWLQNFAYRVSIEADVFVTACILSIIASIITIGFQVYKAADRNPVESLRYE